MPPKKGKEPEPEPVPEGGIDYLEDEREALERDDFVMDLIDGMLGTVYQHAEETVLQNKVAQYAADRLVNDVLGIVNLSFLPREDTSVPSRPEMEVGNNWAPDTENAPAPVDRWARGAVAANIKAQPLELEPEPVEVKKGGRPGSRGSSRPRSAHSQAGSRPKTPSLVPGNARRTTKPASECDWSKPKGLMESRNPTGDAAEREHRLREELKGRQQIEKAKKKQVEEEAAAAAKLDKFQKDLRGKDYSYDHKGNVVMINKVDADRLPEHDITPKTVMMKTAEQLAEEAAAVAAAAAKKAAGSSMGGAKKKKNGNKKDAGIGADEFIKLVAERKPTMMEVMEVKSCVTLRENGASKPGPAEVPDPNHMTRAAFMDLMNSAQMAARERAPRSRGDGDRFSDSSSFSLPEWYGDATKIAPPVEEEVEPVDVNFLLTSKPDWGKNPPPPERPYSPPRPPYKPSQHMMRSTLGFRLKDPRDRPYSTIVGMKKSGLLNSGYPMSPTRSPNTSPVRNQPLSPLMHRK